MVANNIFKRNNMKEGCIEMINHTMGSGPIDLHEYGAYMSYSDESGDYLHRPVALTPYVKTEKRTIHDGEVQRIIKEAVTTMVRNPDTGGITIRHEAPSNEWTVKTQEVYRTESIVVPHEYQSFGKPIVQGDSVTFNAGGLDGRVSGVLEALTDTHFIITNEAGRHYFPWSVTSKASPVRRSQ